MKTLREGQISDLAFFMRNRRCADLSDPGTGKTPPACAYMYWMWTRLGIRTCWVMPKSLLAKNQDELLEWTGFSAEDVVIFDGTPKQRTKLLETSKAKVWLMGFNRFSDQWKDLKDSFPDFDAVVVDEIHMGYKGHKSQRTQNFYKAMKKFDRFLAMTGTLIDGALSSAYPTIHVIEPRYYFSYASFIYEHAVMDMWGTIIGWQNHEKLRKILERHTVRHTFEEVYGKTKIVLQPRIVDMEKAQRKAYDDFHNDALLELEDTFLDGSVEGASTIRARQIMAHPENIKLPVERDPITNKVLEWKSYAVVPEGTLTGKDEQLLIDLEDAKRTGEPLIIFAALQAEQERIVKLVAKEGLRVELINGNVPAKKRGEIDEKFRAGQLDVIVASQETASVGYNWGHVNHIIMVSIDYKNTNWTQALRRAIRGTRKKPLRVSLYKYRNSIDHRIFQIVDAKSLDAHKVDPSMEVLQLAAA